MAYVRDRKGTWYLGYKNERGEWVEIASRARTKTEANRLAFELENKAERVRLGLEAPTPDAITFQAFAERWEREIANRGRPRPWLESRLRIHLLPHFGNMLLSQITTEKVDRFLATKSENLGGCSVEHLRRQMRAMLNWAKRWELLQGANPIASVPPREVPTRPIRYLEAEEIPRVLNALSPRWRGIAAVAIYAGLRKGEIAGLRWEAIDFKRRSICVSHSYGYTTKTKRVRYVPISDELFAFLDEQKAKELSSGLVFPQPDGSMMPPHTRLDLVLRHALTRAGVVQGYEHVCRRKNCGFGEVHDTNEVRRCPKCNMKLWPRVVPKPIRFHDLRSTFATHLYERTQDLTLVQKALGHTTPVLTASTYAGVRDDRAMAGIQTLRFGAAPRTASQDVSGTGPARSPTPRSSPLSVTTKTAVFPEDSSARDMRFERMTFGSGGRPTAFPTHDTASQTLGIVGDSIEDALQKLAGRGLDSQAVSGTLPARVQEPSGTNAQGPGDPTQLLTVKEVAAELRLSTATVYKLIEKGRIPVVRVAGAFVRVRREDLERVMHSV